MAASKRRVAQQAGEQASDTSCLLAYAVAARQWRDKRGDLAAAPFWIMGSDSLELETRVISNYLNEADALIPPTHVGDSWSCGHVPLHLYQKGKVPLYSPMTIFR